MKKQTLNALVMILMLPLMNSCCKEEIYEQSITGLDSIVLNSEGFSPVEYDEQNSIDKEHLAIGIYIRNEAVKIASNEKGRYKNDGAEVMKAAAIPDFCDDPIYIQKNRIESIKVEVIDVDTDERIDITNQMVLVNSQMPISEFISQNEGIGDFTIEFSDTTGIPDRIEYDIEAILDDGSSFSTSGGVISFNH